MTHLLQLLRMAPKFLQTFAALRSLLTEVSIRVLSDFNCEGARIALA